MALFVLFTIMGLFALGAALFSKLPKPAKGALMILAPLLFLAGPMIGSAVTVAPDQIGVVIRHFGSDMKTGAILAKDGEKGPQAQILGPGWHFGYFPFLYDIEFHQVSNVPHGKLGFVTALDGEPLPAGETFAKSWTNAAEMMDPTVFLTKGGQRGPQSTVLTPGNYRYNPRLHKIDLIAALNVEPGTVAVIKSNTGVIPTASDAKTVINGVPLVAEGQRGVWEKPLAPGAYYINGQALQSTIVRTTQRVYTYQQAVQRQPAKNQPQDKSRQAGQDWSVSVRSKDGFSFPVDVRVSVAIEAKEAPYLVALLGDPDRRTKDDQEDEDLEILEAKVILPSVRAIFRNVAETMNALEFVNARSQIEKEASARMRAELAKYHLICEGVYVGNIHLDATDAGQKLLATQTDREVAINQKKLYEEQKIAQESRAAFVKAEEEAEQQRNLAKATYEVKVKEQGALAREKEAEGEAKYQRITGEGRAAAYRAMVETLGREQVAQLELLKLVAEGRIQITPQVMLTSSGNSGHGAIDALAGTLLRQQLPSTPLLPAPAPTPAQTPSTGLKR